jgi:hypothetical protein
MKRLLVLLFLCPLAFADVTTNNPSSSQTNSSGSNTSIQSYEAVTNYNSGSTPVTNNTTTNSTSNNSKTAVAPANAPNLSVYGQSSCVVPLSLGMTTIGFSFSAGNYFVDEACEQRKRAQLLSQVLGMKVAGIALMCQDPKVFEAMLTSGTPCPILHEGKSLIGEEAMKVILERRKPLNDKIEQYRKYKHSLLNNGRK